ncbi:MAG: hypothetical protein N2484_10220 [Clostridia bacterium]|nr:hypothetical protein [Clostridia bacterium]
MKKRDVNNSLKILFSYIMTIVLFVTFIPIVMSVAKSNLLPFLKGYSFLAFVIVALMVYSDSWKIGSIEKKPGNEIKAYPLKGLLLGIMAFSPFILIGLLYPILNFEAEALNRVKHVAFNTMLAPFYFLIKAGNESAIAYILSFFIIPGITMFGYFLGYKGYELSRLFKKSSPVNSAKKQ